MSDGRTGRGPVGGLTNRPVVDAGTLTPTESGTRSFVYTKGDGVSYELRHAPAMCVSTSLATLSEDEMQVLAWMVVNRARIVAAAFTFKVDRRAIAGAIAWEALQNVQGNARGGLRKGAGIIVGPGKLHMVEPSWFSPFGGGLVVPCLSDTNTWPKAVEDAGILPTQTLNDRKARAATDAGAIAHVAASLSLIAAIYEDAGSPGVCSPPMRHNPVILTNVYNARGPSEWKARVATIKAGESLKRGNPMDVWVDSHLQYLEDGVGVP